ncbi:hypothetical protein RBI11_11120 [Acinetobacter baumannii]|uniref:ABC-three component system middle component 1 n=1 Tax=Acinetobacter TaxID=469 RepID=UPI001478F73B|nr:ABC-three component system middle component 1 [Acinetobacter geminorum]
MINIINQVLINNNYKIIEVESSLTNYFINLFQSHPHAYKDEFFITLQSKTQSDSDALDILTEKAEILYEEILNSGIVPPTFKKNSTLIICQEYSKIERTTIYSLEEDPFNFKKNVITYTEEELNSLNSYLFERSIVDLTNETISKIINAKDGLDFLSFKENQENKKDYYSLILKIILKLPFITYIPKEKQLDDLELEIQNSLSISHHKIYKKLLDSSTEWNDENILENINLIWGETE